MVAIGLISYSLYLWHWPIIVFSRYRLGRPPTALETAAIIAASLLAAALSWRFVEQPFRKGVTASARTRSPLRPRYPYRQLGRMGLARAASDPRGVAWLYGRDRSTRRSARGLEPREGCENRRLAELPRTHCLVGDAARQPSVALLGDSFAEALVPALDRSLRSGAVRQPPSSTSPARQSLTRRAARR